MTWSCSDTKPGACVGLGETPVLRLVIFAVPVSVGIQEGVPAAAQL